MAFDWMQYLYLAESIFDHREHLASEWDISEEALCRCAVSRAYYAAFCYARNMACEYMSYRPSSEKAHTHLRDFFIKDMALLRVGSSLGRLMQWRRSCDYDNEIPNKLGNISHLADGAFRYAYDIINILDKRYLS